MSLRSSPVKKTSIKYKYDEQNILNGVYAYIQDTYKEHYSKNNYQATEFIIDAGHGTGFCIGNIMKYAQRYGKKCAKKRSEKGFVKNNSLCYYSIIYRK